MPSDISQVQNLDVAIHFGAHKTATTFLQEYLDSEIAELRRNGVGYIPLHLSRSSIMPFIGQTVRCANPAERPSADMMKASISAALGLNTPNAPPLLRLLISDENLADGAPMSVLAKRTLYPSAASRLRILMNEFPRAKFKLLFCIRDYADFIPSVYCEVLRWRKLAPLARVLSASEWNLSWPVFLGAIAEEHPECDVHYWRYEDFSNSPADVVEAMTGCRLTSVENRISNTVRPSLTKKAVSILQAVRRHLSESEYKRLAECLAENMIFDVGEKLSIDDPILAADLRARYQRDVRTLQDMSESSVGVVRRIASTRN